MICITFGRISSFKSLPFSGEASVKADEKVPTSTRPRKRQTSEAMIFFLSSGHPWCTGDDDLGWTIGVRAQGFFGGTG